MLDPNNHYLASNNILRTRKVGVFLEYGLYNLHFTYLLTDELTTL